MKKFLFLILALSLFTNSALAAIDFDGVDDYVSTGRSMASLSTFTMSGWFKRSASNALVYVASDGVTFNEAVQIGFFSDGNIYLSIGEDGVFVTAASNTTNWVHAAFTFDGSASPKAHLYLDSVDATLTGSFSNTTTDSAAGNLDIGRRGAGALYTSGLIDDVRIYNRAITAAEAATLFNSKLRGTFIGSGLTNYWTINDGEAGTSADGDRIIDSIGTNHGTGDDGALNSGLSWTGVSLLSYPPQP